MPSALGYFYQYDVLKEAGDSLCRRDINAWPGLTVTKQQLRAPVRVFLFFVNVHTLNILHTADVVTAAVYLLPVSFLQTCSGLINFQRILIENLPKLSTV
jgi:hypothetical protein